MPVPILDELRPSLYVYKDGVLLRTAEFDRDEVVIGRGRDCHILLDDQTVSVHHARLVRYPGGYQLEDLDSRNDTLFQDRKIKGQGPQPIAVGQNFRICEFWIHIQSPLVRVEEVDENSSAIRASIDLASSSDVFFRPAKLEETLHALLEVGRTIGSTLDLREILDKTLEALFVIFPQADRGFVYLEGDRPVGDQLAPTAHRVRRRPPTRNTISRAVLEEVLKQGKALCCEDISRHEQLVNSDSLAGDGIRTMLCAPILDRDRQPLGLVQLDARSVRLAFEPKDLDLLIAVVGQLGVAVQNARLHDRLVKIRDAENELAYAREVQLALLPEHPPGVPGYTFWHHYEPARQVGGDYFGYFPLSTSDSSAHLWAIAVADVVGKGMGAALLMAKLSAEVQLALAGDPDPAQILRRFNRRIAELSMPDRFITMVFGVLDTDRHIFTLASAGHPAPVVRRAGGLVEITGEERTGMPLGVLDDTMYESSQVTLSPGDNILLYTDGITEAHAADYHLFGTDRLHEHLSRCSPSPRESGRTLLQAVLDFSRGSPQSDDITLLCLGRNI